MTDLKLGIDARPAKQGAREYTAAIKTIKAAMADLERDTDGLFKKVSATAKNTAPRNVKAQFTAINSALRSAESSASTLHRQLNKIGNVAGLKKVDSALESFRQETTQAALTTTELRAAQDRLAQSFHEVRQQAKDATEIQRLRTQFQRTSAALDATTTGTHAYRRAQLATEQALRSGAISQAQAVKTINAAKAAYTSAGAAAANAAAQQSRLFGVRAGWGMQAGAGRQLGLQINQMAQVAGMSTSLEQALKGISYQAADVGLVFGGMGMAIGSVAGIALPMLIDVLFRAENETEKMKDKVQELAVALDGLEQVSSASAEQIAAHLKTAFGEVAGDVQSLIEDLREAEFSVISRKMQGEIEKATTGLNRLGGAFEIFWSEFATPGTTDAGYLVQINEIIAKSEMSYGQFQKLDAAVKKVFTSQDVNEFVSRLSQARGLAEEIGGPLGERIAAALLQAAKDGGVLNPVLGDAASNSNDLATGLSEGARQALELAGVDMSKPISDAATEAAKLAAQLNISLTAAYNLRQLQESKVYSGRGGDPRQFGHGYTPPKLATVRKGGAPQMSDLERTIQQTKQQNIALKALQSGLFETTTAADAYARAMVGGGGAVDAATMAALKQADAVAHANEQLRKIVRTNKSGALRDDVENSLKGGVKNGLRSALTGDTQNFAQTLADSVYQSLSSAIADALTESLFAKEGGNFLTTVMGLFGAGSEGGYSEALPGRAVVPLSAFRNAPHYAEGTANTSDGIPSILHPNEAVVPLSRGRKIPVELGEGGTGGGLTLHGGINVHVESDGEEDAEFAAKIGESIRESLEGLIDERMAEGMRYGGALNPRGGFV